MDKVQIYIVKTQVTERGSDPFFNPLVPGIVEFGCDENLRTGDSRVADADANCFFITVGEGTVWELEYASLGASGERGSTRQCDDIQLGGRIRRR